MRTIKWVLRILWMSFVFGALFLHFTMVPAGAWGNGGYSEDPDNPGYGTHDWIAQHALDWLNLSHPEEIDYITDNLNAYLLGTEMPDNGALVGGRGDKTFHHVYYYQNQSLQDDAAARRALSEFNRVICYLNYSEYELAAKYAGVMTHYVADLAVFGHVMGSTTDWGSEVHHSDYETYVGERTTNYSLVSDFSLAYDGALSEIDAYDAALQMANTTTFGDGGEIKNCTWMDANYDWSNLTFYASANASINLAVNLLTDVLHTIYVQADPTSGVKADHIVISEVYYDASGIDSVEEYVELYNPTNNTIDISGWRLEDASSSYIIPADSTIASESNFTLARDGDTFRSLTNYTKTADVGDLSISLGNSGDQLTLKDGNGIEIDFVAWENFVSGWDIVATTGRTIQRLPVDADTDTDSEWMSNSLEPFEPSEVPLSPVASLTEDKTTALVGETITFNASTSYDPDGVILSYDWDFGDGTTGSGVTVTHNYSAAGTYTVTLTVTDDSSLTDTTSATKTISTPTDTTTTTVIVGGAGAAAGAGAGYALGRKKKKKK